MKGKIKKALSYMLILVMILGFVPDYRKTAFATELSSEDVIEIFNEDEASYEGVTAKEEATEAVIVDAGETTEAATTEAVAASDNEDAEVATTEAVITDDSEVAEVETTETITEEETKEPITEEKTSESITEEVDNEEVTEEVKEDAAFAQSQIVSFTLVSVTADAGVFPEGSVLKVSSVSNEKAEAEGIKDVIDVKRADDKNVAFYMTYDISIYDADGNEIEPDTTKGNVSVSFKDVRFVNKNLDTDVYHIVETGNGLAAEELATVSEDDITITALTDGFSYYTVEFTYNDMQYELNGDESVALSTILETVGLTGTVSAVEVSNDALFTASNESGEWVVTALCAFNTEEWMKVTIDGVEYVIIVTDDNELTDVSASTMQSAQSEFMKYLTGGGGKSFNVQGVYNGSMIQTTYGNGGYRTAVQVESGEKNNLDGFKYGKLYEYDGVQVRLFADVVDGGRAVAITYELHNKNGSPVTVKIGSSADTKVGDNDHANVYFDGNQLVMEDNSSGSSTFGAQFRIYPGEGDFTTKWYGHYSGAYENMYNSSSGSSSYSEDSGLAWSWTVDIPAGETVSKVAKLKVMKSLEIHDSNLTADLENTKVVMKVPYDDKAGLTQTLHYTIDGGADLGGDTKSTTEGALTNEFTKDIDVSAAGLNWPAGSAHTVKIWLTNNQNVNSATLTYNVFWAGNAGDTDNIKTLKFYSNSGNMFADVKAGSGTVYKLPSDTMNGFVFKGWSKNSDGSGTLYPAGTEYTIEADETLYAVFMRKVTVTFYTRSAETANFSESTGEGLKVARPDDPVNTGCEFLGWYTDYSYTSEYNFDSPVNGDISVYARWRYPIEGVYIEDVEVDYDKEAHSVDVYNDSNATITYGLSEGEYTLDEKPEFTDAGEYTVYYKLEKDGDYITGFGSAKVVINKIDITLSTNNKTKVYGDADPEFDYTVDGMVDGDVLEGVTLSRKEGENVGEYEITVADSSKVKNYNVTVDSLGKLTINPKELKDIKITIPVQTYTGKEIKPEVTIKDGEKEVPASEYTVEYADNTKAGKATITIKDVEGGNYIIETTKANFTIINPGDISVIEPETPNANGAGLADTPSDIIAKINFTDEELDAIDDGKNIFVFLEVKDISDSVSESDKKLVEGKLSGIESGVNATVGMYLDINLYKQIEGQDKVKVSETNGKLKISFEIPEKLRKENRKFYIIRIHDGVVTVITPTQNANILTFETDKFSTYALVYTDSKEADVKAPETPKSAKTGDKAPLACVVVLMFGSCLTSLYLVLRKKK